MEGKNGKNIVEDVQEYFYSDEDFASFFEVWCKDNCHAIDLETEENKLEYTDLYNDFLRAFEDKITTFIEDRGSCVQDFYDMLKAAEHNSDYDIFAQIMNATIDFDVFMQMMRETAHQVSREKGKK